MTRHTPALLHRNSRRPSLSKENLAPAARRSGLEQLEERALLSATPMRSILAQYSAAETSACAVLVADAVLLDQAPTVDLSAALDAFGATLSGSAICFTVQSLSSSPGDSYDAALKTRQTWLDEWSNFYVDLWAYAGGAIVESVEASFTCDASCFALTDVEAAEGYSIEYSTSAGTTSVVATGVSMSDPFDWTLVARMKYAPVADQGIPTSEDGVFAPVDAGFSADPASQKINGAVVESVETPDPDLYPFLFDVDENGVVNTNDLGYFLSYAGQDVEDIAFPKYRVLDYDRNGTINTNDLAYFLQYLGASAVDGFETAYRTEPYVGEPTVLDAPSGISTSAGRDYIAVSWGSVPNAAQYSVAYKLASETTWTTCDAGPDLRYAITGLQVDSEYNVRVVARGNGGRYVDSDWSDPVVVATKDASFFSSTEYEDLRQRYDDFSLPESFAKVNIVIPTDWTAQALVDAIEVARSTPVDDVILLDPEHYSNESLDLSNDVITLDVDYETSGAISIVSRGTERARIVANYYDVTFDATAGLTQFGGFDFIDVNPYVSTYQATSTSAIGFVPTAVAAQNVGAYTWTGVSVADAAQNFARGTAPTVSVNPSDYDFALLFVGGNKPESNYERYYDTLRDYYYELVEDFQLDPTKIYILYADGDVTGTSKNMNTGSKVKPRLTTSDMTFATDIGSTVRASTGANLTSTLGEIANLMTADSHLLFYMQDHGSGKEAFDGNGNVVNPNAPNDYNDYLCGWSYAIASETVRDALFQIGQGYVTCVFTQGFSGGILDDIFDPSTGRLSNLYTGSAHFVGGAATNHYELSIFGMQNGKYIGYPQTFEEALRQCSTGVDAFTYTEQNAPYSRAKIETYARNEGTFVCQKEHPWHVGESFSIFSNFKQNAPTIVSHSETQSSISLTWNVIQSATSYTLEYAVGGSNDVKTVKNISTNSYTVEGLNPETNYVFKVKANDSPYSTPACVWTKPSVQESRSTVVTTTLDVDDPYDGKISLREALNYANPGSTITFVNSLKGKTIALDSELTVSKSIIIDASNLWNATTSTPGLTVSGQGTTRILRLDQGGDVKINGITLTNGYSKYHQEDKWKYYFGFDDSDYSGDAWDGYGGAIFNHGATLFLDNCVVSGSSAAFGGAVYSFRGETTFVNCALTSNTAAWEYDYYGLLDDPCYPVDTEGSGGAISICYGMASFNNCVISGNKANLEGGGIHIAEAETTLVNCILTNNTACWEYDYYLHHPGVDPFYPVDKVGSGGAIYSDEGTLSLDNCVICGNEAYLGGGGLYSWQGETTFVNSTLTNNTAAWEHDYFDHNDLNAPFDGAGSGGAIYNDHATFSLDNCVISDNEANLKGGGVYSYGGETTLVNCTLTDNTADWKRERYDDCNGEYVLVGNGGDGGAINNNGGKLSLNFCVISGNGANLEGGGVYIGRNAVLAAFNSLVTGNEAINSGDGVTLYGTANLYNCTITDNNGYGVYLCETAVLNANNTIIVGNSASYDNDVYFGSSNAVAKASNTLSSFSNWTSGSDNLIYDASEPLFTNVTTGDYTLARNSQAIDKGINMYVKTSVDLVGNPRLSGGTVDLGAYEYQSASSALFDEDAELFDEMEDSLDLIAASLLKLR